MHFSDVYLFFSGNWALNCLCQINMWAQCTPYFCHGINLTTRQTSLTVSPKMPPALPLGKQLKSYSHTNLAPTKFTNKGISCIFLNQQKVMLDWRHRRDFTLREDLNPSFFREWQFLPLKQSCKNTMTELCESRTQHKTKNIEMIYDTPKLCNNFQWQILNISRKEYESLDSFYW